MFLKNKRKLNFGFKKGVTLLELIVVIAIVGIVSSVSWTLMSGNRNAASAQNACEQVAAMINKTRNYALSGKTVGGSVPASFSVVVSSSNVSISGTSESFNIPGGVACDARTFVFSVPYGDCSSATAGGCNTSIVCSVGGKPRTVTVTPNSAVCN